MYRKFTLQPQTAHDVELVFEWDPESGGLRGTGAEIVRNMCERAVQIGYINGHPYPTPYDIKDPLRRPAEMAVVLGQFWVLDADLGDVYPATPNDTLDADPAIGQFEMN